MEGNGNMKSYKLLSLCLVVLFLGCNVSVNKDINIPDGRKIHRSLNSVNGSIRIGTDCKIFGKCRSVNGSIEVGSNSKVEKLQSVNGGIHIMDGAEVQDAVEAVNGTVELDPRATAWEIKTVNGSVDLDSATVVRDIVTYNGDITLDHGSVVRGDIRIKQHKHEHRAEERHLMIEITNHSIVEGDILVYEPEMKVDVILSNGGQLKGKAEKANVIVR
jgi:DUF4097 and DUF4098 domain-containing protein YvlB